MIPLFVYIFNIVVYQIEAQMADRAFDRPGRGRRPAGAGEVVQLGAPWVTGVITGVIKWDLCWGDQTMQIYGNFDGIPL